MEEKNRLRLILLAVALLAGGLVIAGAASDGAPAIPAPDQGSANPFFDDDATPVKGKPGGGTACCDPADQPGTNGNPFCFEGASCCEDGSWACNNPDGSPSCQTGTVCDGPCGSRGDACATGGDCCSGVCGKNGSCR